MSLASGKKITWYSSDAIPMTDIVIRRVDQLGRGQPKRFIFTDQKGPHIGNIKLTGVDEEESQEELDEDDDLKLIDEPDLDEPPALENCLDIRQPVEHHVEPPPLQPTQPPKIVADPIGVAEQAQVPVLEPITGVRACQHQLDLQQSLVAVLVAAVEVQHGAPLAV